MPVELVDLFQQTIDSQYRLNREGKDWQLNDAQQQTITFRAANQHSLAFSLDVAKGSKKTEPLAFFSGQPPSGIAKMCDAMLICQHQQQDYLFLIELKTNHKEDYKKQLMNGKLFCEWLLQLYKEHDHTDKTPVVVGLLIYFPRRSPAKQGTSHRAPRSDVVDDDKGQFDHMLHIKNNTLIAISKLLSQVKRSRSA